MNLDLGSSAKRLHAAVLAVVATFALGAHVSAADKFDEASLQIVEARGLFDDYWEWVLREYPDAAALFFGEDRYPDRLSDEAPQSVKVRNSALRAFRGGAAVRRRPGSGAATVRTSSSVMIRIRGTAAEP